MHAKPRHDQNFFSTCWHGYANMLFASFASLAAPIGVFMSPMPPEAQNFSCK